MPIWAMAALAVGGQLPSNSEADLTRLRGVVKSARMSATNELDTNGSLPPAKLAAMKKMIGSANDLWSACVATTVDANYASTTPAVTVVDRAMTSCRADGAEVGAWVRLAIRGNGETITNDEVATILLRYDGDNRRNAIARVNRLRGRK